MMGASSPSIIIWILLLFVVVLLLAYIISTYNRFVLLKANTDKFFANIDVLLKQRADEIPNLVRVVQAYQLHEQEVLEKVTTLRSQYLAANNTEGKVIANNSLSQALTNLFAVSEGYPNLKASKNFLSLQKRISELETHIADRREFYNDSVNLYNIGIQEFPPVILAKLTGYKAMSMLRIDKHERHNHGVNF